MSSLSEVISVTARVEEQVAEHQAIGITLKNFPSGIHGALAALREDALEGRIPDSLGYLRIDARLYAAAEAQQAFSDCDEYEPAKAEDILRARGFSHRVTKDTDIRWKDGALTKPYFDGVTINDLVVIESSREYLEQALAMFEQLNAPYKGDVWSAMPEDLFYVPEGLTICFGQITDVPHGSADIALDVNDDPRIEEPWEVSVNRLNREALSYLFGANLQERDGTLFVRPR